MRNILLKHNAALKKNDIKDHLKQCKMFTDYTAYLRPKPLVNSDHKHKCNPNKGLLIIKDFIIKDSRSRLCFPGLSEIIQM